jgi:hypothetical protein
VGNRIDAAVYRSIEVEWEHIKALKFEIPYYTRLANYRIVAGFA